MAKKSEDDDQRIIDVGDLLRAHFEPARSAQDASDMRTTSQLFALIDEHSPDLVKPAQLRDVLITLGYNEQLVGSEFMWMLKRRA